MLLTRHLTNRCNVALIAPTFASNLFDDQVTLMELAATVDDRIEPYPFTDTTFTMNNPLAYEIQRYGIRLYPQMVNNAA